MKYDLRMLMEMEMEINAICVENRCLDVVINVFLYEPKKDNGFVFDSK